MMKLKIYERHAYDSANERYLCMVLSQKPTEKQKVYPVEY